MKYPINQKVDFIRVGKISNSYLMNKIVTKLSHEKARATLSFARAALNKVHPLLTIDLERVLASHIPECDVSIAIEDLCAYAIDRSRNGTAKFYHLQHYLPLFEGSKYYNNYYLYRQYMEVCRLPLNITANSLWLQKKLKQELSVESQYAPLIFLDTSIFNTKKKESEKLQRIFSDKSKHYIITLGKGGKGNEWKGLNNVFKALIYLKKKKPELKLHLIMYGNQPYLADQCPVEHTYVKTPSENELAFLYQNADVAITASWAESLPFPPLEAMACGTKVITTRYGVEDYAKDKYNAIVIDPLNTKMLADAIFEVLRNPEYDALFRKNGPATVRRWDWKTQVDRYEKMYTHAVTNPHDDGFDSAI